MLCREFWSLSLRLKSFISNKATGASEDITKVNIYQNAAERIYHTLLDDDSVTAWYAVHRKPFVVALLEGKREPRIEVQEEFNSDVTKFKVALDVGVAPIEWRAAYKKCRSIRR